MTVAALVASIPSPSSGSLEIGPLRFNAYGLMIALGVIAAVRVTARRAESRGLFTGEQLSAIAMWAVPAGVVGARIYHVVTDLEAFRGRWFDVVKIWQGGLGIWGGVLLGVVVGMWRASRLGVDPWWAASMAVPGIAVAQAIGRWGNWWNQELFGRPTDLPWALRVSPGTAIDAGYGVGTTFHPTFMYESLWCLLLAWILVRIERRWNPGRGRLVAWYVAGYTLERFFVEGLRIDPAHSAGGLRLNQWVSIVGFVAAVGFLIVDRRRSRVASAPSTVSPHE